MTINEVLGYVSRGVLTAQQADDLLKALAREKAIRNGKTEVKAQPPVALPDGYEGTCVVKTRKSAPAKQTRQSKGFCNKSESECLSRAEDQDAQWAYWVDMPEGTNRVMFGKVLVKALFADQRRDAVEQPMEQCGQYHDPATTGLVGDTHTRLVAKRIPVRFHAVERDGAVVWASYGKRPMAEFANMRKSRKVEFAILRHRKATYRKFPRKPIADGRFDEGIETPLNGKDFENPKYVPLHPVYDEQEVKGLLEWNNGAVSVTYYGCALPK